MRKHTEFYEALLRQSLRATLFRESHGDYERTEENLQLIFGSLFPLRSLRFLQSGIPFVEIFSSVKKVVEGRSRLKSGARMNQNATRLYFDHRGNACKETMKATRIFLAENLKCKLYSL